MSKQLARGRESYKVRAWAEAYEAFALASRSDSLSGEDLELFAMTAYLTGRDDEYLDTLDRAHRAYLDAGEPRCAARVAFWLSLRLMFRGSIGPANGWLARAQRLLEGERADCAEQGYILLAISTQLGAAHEWDAAYAKAQEALVIGERCGDADLSNCARMLQGRSLIQQGHVERGLVLLDEAMVAVIAGELSPLVTGLIYCSVIEGCQEIYAFGRAREWTQRYGDPRDPKVDPVDWVERIPFSETRFYVQRVMENMQVYRVLFGESPGFRIEADLARGRVSR